MSDVDPYETPGEMSPPKPVEVARKSAISTEGTVMPRYVAAVLDKVLAFLLSVIVAKLIGEEQYALQVVVFVLMFFGYYLIFELLFARTPGKLLTGLMVVQFNGKRCTWRHALIRTGLRVLEVNPVLLGSLPAAVSIVATSNHQRIGDVIADTVVVPARRVPK